MTITKTFTYDAAAVSALMARTYTLATPALRFAARETVKSDAQRAWVRGGKIGANPACFL